LQNTLWIGNIYSHWTDYDITKLFKAIGKGLFNRLFIFLGESVKDIKLIRNRTTD